jgi:hypothetical protein
VLVGSKTCWGEMRGEKCEGRNARGEMRGSQEPFWTNAIRDNASSHLPCPVDRAHVGRIGPTHRAFSDTGPVSPAYPVFLSGFFLRLP